MHASLGVFITYAQYSSPQREVIVQVVKLQTLPKTYYTARAGLLFEAKHCITTITQARKAKNTSKRALFACNAFCTNSSYIRETQAKNCSNASVCIEVIQCHKER